MGISEQFGIDEIDKNIIMLLQRNPSITHSEIAKKIGRSQPAVGSRIHRLEEKGVISSKFGLNFKSTNIFLVKVELSTKNPDEIYEMGRSCPFVINCMKLSGENNMMVLLASSTLKKIDAVVDCHFRKNKESITNIKMDIITDYLKDFVLPVDFSMDEHEPDPENGCGNSCDFMSKKK